MFHNKNQLCWSLGECGMATLNRLEIRDDRVVFGKLGNLYRLQRLYGYVPPIALNDSGLKEKRLFSMNK